MATGADKRTIGGKPRAAVFSKKSTAAKKRRGKQQRKK